MEEEEEEDPQEANAASRNTIEIRMGGLFLELGDGKQHCPNCQPETNVLIATHTVHDKAEDSRSR